MTRKMVQIDSETHKRLRMVSAEQGVTIGELVREAVAQCNMDQVLLRIREPKTAEI